MNRERLDVGIDRWARSVQGQHTSAVFQTGLRGAARVAVYTTEKWRYSGSKSGSLDQLISDSTFKFVKGVPENENEAYRTWTRD